MTVCFYSQHLTAATFTFTVTFGTNFGGKIMKTDNFPTPQSIFCWFCEAVLIMTFCGFFVWSGQYIGRVVSSNDRGKVVHCTCGKVLEKYPGSIHHVLWSVWALSMYNWSRQRVNQTYWCFWPPRIRWFMKAKSKTNILTCGEKTCLQANAWIQATSSPFQGRHVCGVLCGVWGSVIFHCV